MRRHKYALKTFVKWVLVLRLLMAAILVAVTFGVITYMYSYERISESVQLIARNSIEWMRADLHRLRDTSSLDLRAAVQEVINTTSILQLDRHYGQFTYVRFYKSDGSLLGERAAPIGADTESLTSFITSSKQQFPKAGELWQQNIDILGHPYIHVVLPVLNRQGALAAWGEGLFRVSEEALVKLHRTALKTALFVSLIVIATALLLYPVILSLMRRLARYSESLLASNLEIMEVLGSAIAKRDSDTDAHNYRVTLYSLRLAEIIGLDDNQTRALIKGAFLHDVGKIGIRDHILHKPDKLDADEFRVMQNHINHGLDIVHRSRWLADAEDVVGSHHEKYDGSGYPKHLSGEEIPMVARIFAIADVFDALTSRRPYKEPLSFEATMRILNNSRGQHFDPSLVDNFSMIARELYERYSGRDDDELRAEVRAIVKRYFIGGLDTLRY